MAQVKMYNKKDRRFVNFPIACTPSEDEFDILPALKGGDSQVANVPCEGEPSSYGYSLMRQCPASVY